jgi:hypothetical protein
MALSAVAAMLRRIDSRPADSPCSFSTANNATAAIRTLAGCLLVPTVRRLSALLGLVIFGGPDGCCRVVAAIDQSPRTLTKEARLAFIQKAQVWSPTDVSTMNLRDGPGGPGAFHPNELVTCDYVERKMPAARQSSTAQFSPMTSSRSDTAGATAKSRGRSSRRACSGR